MIIRILSEGQYRLGSAHLDRLNEIDNQLVEVVAADQEEEYKRLFSEMLELVRREGEPLGPEEIVESDIILPAPDTSLAEAKGLFIGAGLVPD
jgi:hypothetical protein